MDRTALACAASVAVHVVAGLVLLELPVAPPRPAALPMEVRAVATTLPGAPVAAAVPTGSVSQKAKAGAGVKPHVRRVPGRKSASASASVSAPASASVSASGSESASAPGSESVSDSASASPSTSANGGGNGGGGGRAGAVVLDPAHPPEATENYTRIVPPYSDAAIDSDVNGAVSLRLDIDATGRVVRASVLHGLGHGLDEIAVATALKYRFHPARDADGKPVRTVIGWNVVWESYWKRLVVETISGHPNCRGHGPMNLGETHPEYIDCDHPAGEFDLDPADAARP